MVLLPITRKLLNWMISNPTYYDNRALSKTEKENYAGAVEDYTFSIELYPSDPETYYQRGLGKVDDE
jgi:hypothetical protein